METDKIIEVLNGKDYLQDAELTADEQAFLEAYRPENVLIVYGTLAPGAPNHHIVEHIKGQWREGIVRGALLKLGWGADMGYNAFKHVKPEEQTEIKAFALFSDELPANWAYLDEFEGEGYRRVLAKFEPDNGNTSIGYIYAIHEMNH